MNNNLLWKSKLGLALFALVVLGCSLDGTKDPTDRSSDGGVLDERQDERQLEFGGTRTCDWTLCDCTEKYDDCMSDCFRLAPYLSYDCGGACMDRWCLGSCGHDPNGCGLYTYDFKPSRSNSNVVEACEQANEHERECGTNVVGDDCARAGVTESEDALTYYECVATTSCEADGEACLPESKSTFIEAACDEISRLCIAYYCTSDWRELISRNEAWFSEDAMEAGYACMKEGDCRNVRACLEGWNWALFGDTPSWVIPFDFQ